jgi:hypothetical protein
MLRTVAIALLIFAATETIHACSCVMMGDACSALGGAGVVFVGRVIVDSGDGLGERPARVVVEEFLHGGAITGKEVEVNSMPHTSCYVRLQLGERYVIFASARSGESDHFSTGGCSFTTRLSGNELLLNALRRQALGEQSTLVGHVYRRDQKPASTSPPPVGIKVIAEASDTRLETSTVSGGQFEFINVPPGDYGLRIESPTYILDPDPFWNAQNAKIFKLRKNQCSVGTVWAVPNGGLVILG